MHTTIQLLSPFTLTLAAALLGVGLLAFALLRWCSGPPAAVKRPWGLRALRWAAVLTLVLILLNPSRVLETPGPVECPDLFFLLDTSESMAVGEPETRFDQAVQLMREAEQATRDRVRADIKLFRFGHRLAAIDDPSTLQLGLQQDSRSSRATADASTRQRSPTSPSSGQLHAAEMPAAVPSQAGKPVAPTETDTQLLTALRQISSRFGRRLPAGIVIFSDGRAREETGNQQIAAQFARLKVPVHVAPVGGSALAGDVAIVACVVPPRARRFSEVEMQVFLRSYGYDGQRCELTLTTTDENIAGERQLTTPVAVTLHDGFQSVPILFRTEDKTRHLKVAASLQQNEVSTANNTFRSEIQIDRSKIRVLYIEGSSQAMQAVQRGNRYEVRGPYSDLQLALQEDEDIECVVLTASSITQRLRRVQSANDVSINADFPKTIAELSAFDAIILSDVGARTLTEQQFDWIRTWIGQRGGGLMMVGGPRSFAAGGWDDTPVADILPVTLLPGTDWVPGTQVQIRPDPTAASHPLWAIVADHKQNQKLLDEFPSFLGVNRWAGMKTDLTTLLASSDLNSATSPLATTAVTRPKTLYQSLQKKLVGSKRPVTQAPQEAAIPAPDLSGSATLPSAVANQPAIVAGRYGRGRTLVMAMPVTSPWANEFITRWGGGDAGHYGKFWRNAIYWLTENSSIGRRRLVVTPDKRFYRPGETIALRATAFDEFANQTGAYKIGCLIEPQGAPGDVDSENSPLIWPADKPRESGETGPMIVWGEEFDLPRIDAGDGKAAFALNIPIADALTVGSARQSLRIELTALDEFTQVDSTSVDIQILHDPFEQQNPFPNHELLASIAEGSHGRVIHTPDELAEVMTGVPVERGLPTFTQAPLWSTWWMWTVLLGLLTVEWMWRRRLGLA
ncbi:MAG TPA: glutamine amidotransferase [Planctomycetaceae bacterium]|nr:glutamine amidotransferase [Planctomycetaceae bacterium]